MSPMFFMSFMNMKQNDAAITYQWVWNESKAFSVVFTFQHMLSNQHELFMIKNMIIPRFH